MAISPDNYLLCHHLAASAFDAGYDSARELVAPSIDRYFCLTYKGMVTQFSRIRVDARLEQQALRQEVVIVGKPLKISLDRLDGRNTGRALTPTNPTGELAIDVALVPGWSMTMP